MKALLPIRPPIKKDENVLGYIIRLAHVNHFKCLQECIKSYFTHSLPKSYGQTVVDKLSQFASDLVGRDIQVNSNNIVGEFSAEPSVKELKRFSISRKPCICTECVREDGYLKSAWQFTFNSYCSKHRTEHINICQSCKRELQWNTDLLKLNCQRCGSKLRGKILEVAPEHIKHSQGLSEKERWEYTFKLFEYAHALMRPYDLMYKKITESPIMVRNWNELFTTAAKLLSTGEKHPTAYELHTIFTESSCYDDFIQSPLAAGMRQVVKRTPTNEECRNFMDSKALKKWFGLETYHLDECVQMNYAKVLFKKAYCGSLIYDFRDWHEMFNRFRLMETEGVPIQTVEAEAPALWCHEEEVVVGILRGRIPVRFACPKTPNFKQAFVDRQATHRYLKKQKTLFHEPMLTSHQAQLVLGGERGALRPYIRSHQLKTISIRPHISMVCTDSLKDIIDKNRFPIREKIINAYPNNIGR